AGLIEGKEEGKAQYRALIEKANACVEASLKDYDRTIAQSDEMIVELAVRSAEKIIKQHLNEPRARQSFHRFEQSFCHKMIVELAVRSAEKIIKQHLSQHPESFVEIVKAAINELKDH